MQIYSDEVRLRKPDPELARLAARELDVPVRDCWFVGDMVDRDILCAHRAGSGSVLMRSSRTDRAQRMIDVGPDAVVDDGYGLFDLLMQSIRS